MPSTAFNVYLDGKKIDTVFYSSAFISASEVKRALVNHDNYSQDIVVRKRYKSAQGGRE